MTPHPIPRYLSRPKLFFLLSILVIALFAPTPFAVISPGPVTDLLDKEIKITGGQDLTTSGKLFSLSVFVNNPESRPPGFLVLAAWIRGESLVLPNEIVYEKNVSTKESKAQGKKDMRTSETRATIAAANFIKALNPNEPPTWSLKDIEFAMKKVGGPSAGLAFSLALIAKLKSPELISGRNIAVTGTINESGAVGRIGGIDQKLISAKQAGVTIAIIPKSNCSDITIETGGMQVIAVKTLTQAVHGLASQEFSQTMLCDA